MNKVNWQSLALQYEQCWIFVTEFIINLTDNGMKFSLLKSNWRIMELNTDYWNQIFKKLYTFYPKGPTETTFGCNEGIRNPLKKVRKKMKQRKRKETTVRKKGTRKENFRLRDLTNTNQEWLLKRATQNSHMKKTRVGHVPCSGTAALT
jgi:hypothetical protein